MAQTNKIKRREMQRRLDAAEARASSAEGELEKMLTEAGQGLPPSALRLADSLAAAQGGGPLAKLEGLRAAREAVGELKAALPSPAPREQPAGDALKRPSLAAIAFRSKGLVQAQPAAHAPEPKQEKINPAEALRFIEEKVLERQQQQRKVAGGGSADPFRGTRGGL